MIDLEVNGKETGDKRFRRFEYWGIGSYFVLHYVGDHTLFVPFKHRNSQKQTKPFVIRSAPHVKDKVCFL